MRPPGILAALTPMGWSAAGVAVIIAGLALANGLGLRWDPFDLSAHRLRSAEAHAAAAERDAHARRLEVEGANVQADRLDRLRRQTAAAQRATVQTTEKARAAHDATILVDPHRAARLREHDVQLCRIAPSVCVAPASDFADDGGDALRSRPPARNTDARRPRGVLSRAWRGIGGLRRRSRARG